MSSSWMGVVGFFSVGSVVVGCSSSCPIEPRYAEYSLDPGRYPESVSCFYECERSASQRDRDACFAACDGVVAWETQAPCVPGSLELCRSYALFDQNAKKECESTESDAEVAVDVVTLLFGIAIDATEDDGAPEPRTRDPVPGTSKQSNRSRACSSSSRLEWSKKSTEGASPASKLGSSSKLRRDD
jgi:hypothetical protein